MENLIAASTSAEPRGEHDWVPSPFHRTGLGSVPIPGISFQIIGGLSLFTYILGF